jgi:hypothetical protein
VQASNTALGRHSGDFTQFDIQPSGSNQGAKRDYGNRSPDPNQFCGSGDRQADKVLRFFYDNCAFFTDFNAALASETFLGVHRYGFPVLHLKYFNGTYVYAFFATGTFFFIDDRIESHYENLLSV